jgi:hypothetical protein
MTDDKDKSNGKAITTADKLEEMWKAAKEDPSFVQMAAKPAQDKASKKE